MFTKIIFFKMHVHEVEDGKALWLALRADAHNVLNVLSKTLGVPAPKVHELERRVYCSVIGNCENVTHYHMEVYRELLSQIRLAHPDMQKSLVEDFNTNMPKLVKLYTSHISVFLHAKSEEVQTYDSESKKLFYTVVRPKLMALGADTKNELPPCPTCRTNEFMGTIAIQTRSGDEAATLFPKCMKCQKIQTDHALNN
jgi:DNA-directed RNA polymerase subunit M/transcription elongation factor TFIIS